MIPLLDWTRARSDRAGLVADLGAAVRGTGFFLLKNSDIDPDLRTRVLNLSDAVFALPEGEKEAVAISNTPHYRGWARPGVESLDETRGEVDTKQTFNIGYDLAPNDPRVGEPFRGPNQWPPLPGFREKMLAYYDAAQAQGVAILSLLAEDLGLPPDHFAPLFDAPLSALRLLHYPPATGAAGEIGAGAHTDYGAITLLMTDGEPGLQVRPRGGDWTDVPHVPGAYVVNIGDCLMRWSNDIYVSTPHRVLPPARTRRSVAFFVEANPDALVTALPGTGAAKYPPIRAADYLASRLDATYAPKVPT
ncbi:isopenicillin N synthase family dioxygenase [Jannaschia donghaensis]|uniref:2-oxoglutarate-dependent ethylene/succinate-forming enzyme n=1 Tax=Jannaschia donghaensis TaxID=420998 RepID=A0A0M6YGA0_9RHOB|nr:2-oxoglutarate and iron-dependent oxygenase domain-containing protein [Jannaschia donghaensis]CTQ48106.1 2-oxoglutarate-dependent ethylene/succinate-forming enzyme [Jannaschia donghaensis]